MIKRHGQISVAKKLVSITDKRVIPMVGKIPDNEDNPFALTHKFS